MLAGGHLVALGGLVLPFIVNIVVGIPLLRKRHNPLSVFPFGTDASGLAGLRAQSFQKGALGRRAGRTRR